MTIRRITEQDKADRCAAGRASEEAMALGWLWCELNEMLGRDEAMQQRVREARAAARARRGSGAS
jgi:hypothetical protein